MENWRRRVAHDRKSKRRLQSGFRKEGQKSRRAVQDARRGGEAPAPGGILQAPQSLRTEPTQPACFARPGYPQKIAVKIIHKHLTKFLNLLYSPDANTRLRRRALRRRTGFRLLTKR